MSGRSLSTGSRQFRQGIFLALLMFAAEAAHPQDRVVVSFEALQSSITVHELAQAEFSLLNRLAEKLFVDLGVKRKGNFQLTVITPDKSKVALPPFTEGGPGPSGWVYLTPGETYKQTLLLNEWYAFSTPGTYVVQVKVLEPVRTVSGMLVQSDLSGQFTLDVEARNPERLKRQCEELAKTAVESPDLEASGHAAHMLSYVLDPIAVAYLAEVLKSGRAGRHTAVWGLARIGNPEAIQVLRSNLDTQEGELKSSIEAALFAIQHGKRVQVMD